jgi:hypothetical protein
MAYNLGSYQALNISAVDQANPMPNRDNAGIHPLFGIIVTDNLGVASGTQASLTAMYQDTVPRELGISSELVKNNRILKGLAAPGTYLLQKNQDLERIGTELTDIYKSEYIKQYNKGKSVEEAKKIALRYTKTVEEMKLKEHDEDFPVELTRETISKLKRKNEQGDF